MYKLFIFCEKYLDEIRIYDKIEKAQNKSEKTKEKHLKWQKLKPLVLYIYIGQFIQKGIGKLNNKIRGGNTFICDRGKGRLEL